MSGVAEGSEKKFRAIEDFFLTIHRWPWRLIYEAAVPFTCLVLFGYGVLAAWLAGIQVANWLIPSSANLPNLQGTVEVLVAIGFLAMAIGYGYFVRRIGRI
jgi:hypothetical protein